MRRVSVCMVALSLWVAVESAPRSAHARGFWEDLGTFMLIVSVIAVGAVALVGSTILPLAENTSATLDGVRSSSGWRVTGWIGGGVDLAIGVPCLYESVRLSRRGESHGTLFAIGATTSLLGIGNLTMATTSQMQPERH